MLIHEQSDMEVVGEATNGREAIEKAHALSPDVTLLDISMPEGSGITAIGQILHICPHTRILVLTMHTDPAYVRSALAAGGTGYLAKRSAHSDLLIAIRTVYRGRMFVDPTVTGSLVQDLLKHRTNGLSPHAGRTGNLLSLREREVLQLLVQGYTNREIADRLFVSVKTVETHRSRGTQKLGVQGRADLVRYASESGLFTPESLMPDDGNR
jgi:two-component system response regulator NreC